MSACVVYTLSTRFYYPNEQAREPKMLMAWTSLDTSVRWWLQCTLRKLNTRLGIIPPMSGQKEIKTIEVFNVR